MLYLFVVLLLGNGEMGFPGSSAGKESACNAGDPSSIPELERSPGGGHGNPHQYSCLENPMDRGAWRATVHEVTRVGHDLATKPTLPTLTHNYCGLTWLRRNTYFTDSENYFNAMGWIGT